MEIETLSRPGPEWDEFAESHPDARLGHASAWAFILREAYGLEPMYLAVRSSGGGLAGILPLVVFRSRPGGAKRLISLPYLDGSGILARDAEAGQRLLSGALELARARGADALELRNGSPVAGLPTPPTADQDRVNLALALESDVEAQWAAFRAKVRNQARKADREGLSLLDGASSLLFERFYAPFAENMRDLGSPVHSAGFFRAAGRHFSDRLRFIVTCDADRPVGGLVAIRFGDRVTVPWASTLRSERKRCPNNQIYWEAIRWAVESGARTFDFGRSPIEGGTYRFKKGWGATEEPLCWQTFARDGTVVPSAPRSANGVLDDLSRVWTRLPVPVATWIGARIRRYFAN